MAMVEQRHHASTSASGLGAEASRPGPPLLELAGRRVVVIGLGASGIAAARLCRERGAEVTAADRQPLERLAPEARELATLGIALLGGNDQPEALATAELVVVSPGVPAGPALAAAEQRGSSIISELELGARFLSAPVLLVGGTNGKSTVTALCGDMLRAAGQSVFVGGNFGTPLCEAVGAHWDALVVEISSFQAERVPTLHARVHALLNVSEDHLDRYPSFQAYADAKGNPFVAMGEGDVAVIPAGDAACAAQAARGRARLVTFSAELDADVAPRGTEIVDRVHGGRYPLSLLTVQGRHNVANACAAIASAAALGASPPAIATALGAFRGLAHRTVLVAERDGVRYFDDSKGTNVGAAVAALRGLREARAVLIAGGRDKLGAYGPLVAALRERGRALVVLGEAAERIAQAAAGALPVVRVTSMREAVHTARELAQPGDAVLLSPACSSYDMFRNYKERGEAFVAAVRAELDGASSWSSTDNGASSGSSTTQGEP
jgi:UDP-N-acetylmuramoylalanine--D-glutamate ligase